MPRKRRYFYKHTYHDPKDTVDLFPDIPVISAREMYYGYIIRY